MAQSTILAAATTAATSTDVVVATGVHVHVGVFGAATTSLPYAYRMQVMMDTPNGDLVYDKLSSKQPVVKLVGPGTFRVVRAAYAGPAFGVFLET